jgi:RNA polymerase sigma-70 factor (ECF subfamily)
LVAESGFDEFYQGSRQRVVAFLYAMSGDRGEAQDAAQEAYVRAWQRWSTISTYEDPEAWVRKVGYNLCASRFRKARNRVVAYRRHGADAAVAPPSEDTVVLVAALKRLPVRERQVIVLHHLLDMSVADIAAQTGTPANTIKSQLVRGRQALAAMVGKEPWGEYLNA